MDWINIIWNCILPKRVYRFSTISINIPITFFTQLKKIRLGQVLWVKLLLQCQHLSVRRVLDAPPPLQITANVPGIAAGGPGWSYRVLCLAWSSHGCWCHWGSEPAYETLISLTHSCDRSLPHPLSVTPPFKQIRTLLKRAYLNVTWKLETIFKNHREKHLWILKWKNIVEVRSQLHRN